MKRIFLALTFVAACIAASAQVKVYRLESVGENEAYVVNVPTYIRTTFETTYPGTTTVVWQPTEELWRATFLENNCVSNVYYTSNGDSYRTSLPVLMTFVPEEIVTDAINKYGTALYSITRMKGSDGGDLYQVGLLDNTMQGYVVLDAQGEQVSEIKKWKIEKDGDMKIKTETEKIKVKVDNE